MKPVLILGSGDHAHVVLDTLTQINIKDVLAFVDINTSNAQRNACLPVLDETGCLNQKQPKDVVLLNGVGGLPGMDARQILFEKWHTSFNFEFIQLIHPSCYVSPKVTFGTGVQIFAQAAVQTGCHVSDNVLINTSTVVEHDCHIGRHAVIAPGAVLCGGVQVGDRAYVGANATVVQGVKIGSGSVVAAGAVVINDVPANTLVRGTPAKETTDGQLARRLSQTKQYNSGDAASN